MAITFNVPGRPAGVFRRCMLTELYMLEQMCTAGVFGIKARQAGRMACTDSIVPPQPSEGGQSCEDGFFFFLVPFLDLRGYRIVLVDKTVVARVGYVCTYIVAVWGRNVVVVLGVHSCNRLALRWVMH
jgi:hypothetical protein